MHMNNDTSFDDDKKTADSDSSDDSFVLYDLRVEVVKGDLPMICNHQVGDYFLVQGESLIFEQVKSFPMYAVATVLPFLPAKQRETDSNDWMTTDTDIACPDPHCGGRFRITRTGKRVFKHSETTGLPADRGTPYWHNDDKT